MLRLKVNDHYRTMTRAERWPLSCVQIRLQTLSSRSATISRGARTLRRAVI
jgi:hypothetical protein